MECKQVTIWIILCLLFATGKSFGQVSIEFDFIITELSPVTDCGDPNGAIRVEVLGDADAVLLQNTEIEVFDELGNPYRNVSITQVAPGIWDITNLREGTITVAVTVFGVYTKVLQYTLNGPICPFVFYDECNEITADVDFIPILYTVLTPFDSIWFDPYPGDVLSIDTIMADAAFPYDAYLIYYRPSAPELDNGQVNLVLNAIGRFTEGGLPVFYSRETIRLQAIVTSTTLSNNTIPHSLVPGTYIGEFTFTDCNPESKDVTIVSVDSGYQPSDFYVDNGILYSNTTFSPTDNSITLTLDRTDSSKVWVRPNQSQVTIQILPNVNVPPLDISLSNIVVNRDAEIGTTIGLLEVIDQDFPEEHDFRIKALNGVPFASDPFMVIGHDLRLSQNIQGNNNFYILTIEVIDTGGNTFEKDLLVYVNSTPEDITLSNNQLADGSFISFGGNLDTLNYLGTFNTVDNTPNDVFRYQLVDGFGDDHNDEFLIPGNGDRLLYLGKVDLKKLGSNTRSIRVRSTDQFDAFVEKTFTIEFIDDQVPQIVSIDDLPYFDMSLSQEVIKIVTDDNYKMGKYEIYTRGIRDDGEFDLETFETSDFSYNYDLNRNQLDELGVEYFFRVYDDYDNFITSDTFRTYKLYDSTFPSFPTLEVNGNDASYEIITVPYDLEDDRVSALFQAQLGEQTKETWRLLGYDPVSGKYLEYPDGISELERGRGYWFNSKIDITGLNTGNAKSPSNSKEDPFIMQLVSGWNLVGNPYDFPLDMGVVVQYNPGITGIYGPVVYLPFSGYADTLSLPPFKGAWFFSQSDQQVIIPVNLPPGASGGRIEKDEVINIDKEDWTLPLDLQSGDKRFSAGALGVSPESEPGMDGGDIPMIPMWSNTPSVSFSMDSNHGNKFLVDRKSSKVPGQWQLEVDLAGNSSGYISWPEIEGSSELWLIDSHREELIDMKVQNGYYISGPGKKNFKIFYAGQPGTILKMLSGSISSLGDPYPNPFHSKVRIPVVITADETQILLSVYSSHGQRMVIISEETLEMGRYEYTYEMPSSFRGTYILVLQTMTKGNSEVFTKRIISK